MKITPPPMKTAHPLATARRPDAWQGRPARRASSSCSGRRQKNPAGLPRRRSRPARARACAPSASQPPPPARAESGRAPRQQNPARSHHGFSGRGVRPPDSFPAGLRSRHLRGRPRGARSRPPPWRRDRDEEEEPCDQHGFSIYNAAIVMARTATAACRRTARPRSSAAAPARGYRGILRCHFAPL